MFVRLRNNTNCSDGQQAGAAGWPNVLNIFLHLLIAVGELRIILMMKKGKNLKLDPGLTFTNCFLLKFSKRVFLLKF